MTDGNVTMKKLQLTLAILKPDLCMREKAREVVKTMIRCEQFFIVRQTEVHLNRIQAQQFYAEHTGKFFYDRLVDFMCIHPIDCMILAHPNAIHHWRTLMGPTKPYRAQVTAPHTIRGIYGLTDTRNSTHGSDSEKSAEREISILFPDFNISDWYHNEEMYFQKGEVKFCTKEQIHKPEKLLDDGEIKYHGR